MAKMAHKALILCLGLSLSGLVSAEQDKTEEAVLCEEDADIEPLLGKLEKMAGALLASTSPCFDAGMLDVEALTPAQDDAYALCEAVWSLESYRRSRSTLCEALESSQDIARLWREREGYYIEKIDLLTGNVLMFKEQWKAALELGVGRSGKKWSCLAGGFGGLSLLSEGEEELPRALGLGLSCGWTLTP